MSFLDLTEQSEKRLIWHFDVSRHLKCYSMLCVIHLRALLNFRFTSHNKNHRHLISISGCERPSTINFKNGLTLDHKTACRPVPYCTQVGHIVCMQHPLMADGLSCRWTFLSMIMSNQRELLQPRRDSVPYAALYIAPILIDTRLHSTRGQFFIRHVCGAMYTSQNEHFAYTYDIAVCIWIQYIRHHLSAYFR